MKLSHPVRACDEAIYFKIKFVQKSIDLATKLVGVSMALSLNKVDTQI